MNLAAFHRKLIYMSAIVVLMIPLFFLGQPKSGSSDNTSGGGGTLATLRERHHIGQADLGQIDPASETMRLATLGMRGFAATMLWHKADYYKREKYWDRYSATLNQIALLQPHFINVWEHQAHNLTYNISVEFDGYKQRYEWVKKGIDYLIRGTTFNQRQPILQWHLGIYTGQKIGVADEKKQFRQLFRNDSDYHQKLAGDGLEIEQNEVKGRDGKPDHWLVGRLWFEKSYDLVAKGYFCKKSPHIYYSDSPKCWLRFSEAIEEEGILDDFAKISWQRSEKYWGDFGQRDVMTTWGHTVKLNALTEARKKLETLLIEFRDNSGEAESALREELRSQLSKEEQNAMDIPPEQRDAAQNRIAFQAQRKMVPTVMQIAEKSSKSKRDKVLTLATQVSEAEQFLSHLDSYRNQVNYEYWQTRAIAEQLDTTLEAHRLMYEADRLLQDAKINEAIAKYELAWKNWAIVFGRYPVFMTDDSGTDVLKSIRRYKRILDTEEPADFPLKDFVRFKEMYDKGGYDFEVEKMLEKWRRDAAERGDDIDFFQTEMFRQDILRDAKSGVMIPTEENRKLMQEDEKGEMPKPAENPSAPPATPGTETPPKDPNTPEAAAGKENVDANAPPSNRPPELENPTPIGDGGN